MIAILAPFLLQYTQTPLVVEPSRLSTIYQVGETIKWTIPENDSLTGSFSYELRRNNFEKLAEGKFDPSAGSSAIEFRADKPSMLFLQVTTPTGQTKDFAASIDPLQIKPTTPKPDDFDSFWARKITLTKNFDHSPIFTPIKVESQNTHYATFKMNHPMGGGITGQIAKPEQQTKRPAMLILQWAGGPYSLDKSWILGHAQNGWITMNIQAHDVEPVASQDYYNNLPAELKNYTSINQSDPETNYFVRMYLSGYVALNQLMKDPQWDGKTLLVMGTSMGGQQAIALAGLHPNVTHLIANVPAGSDMNASSQKRQLGYPNFDLNNPKAAKTAQYIDCINLAPNIKAQSLIGLGFIDTVCPPYGIWATFNAIKGSKEIAPMPDSPHNHLATPAQQQPINHRTYEWLTALSKGEKVKPRSLTEVLAHNFPQ